MYEYTVAIVDDEAVIRSKVKEYFAAYESERGNHMMLTEFAAGEELL